MISFKDRLRHTIAQLSAETQQGLEDWTSTINKCQDLLAELEQEELETATGKAKNVAAV